MTALFIPIPTSFTPEQEEIFIGLMLGDGCINRSKRSKNDKEIHPRLSITRTAGDIEYLKWQYEKFKNFYGSEPIIYSTFDKRTNKTYHSCHSATRTGDIFHKYYYEWYPNNKKVIKRDIKLTPLTLLVWFLDDGCIITENKKLVIQFSTDGFSKKDVEFLINLLSDFTGQHFKIYECGKNKYRIRGATPAAISIIKIIDPIFLPCMDRKRTWKDYDFKFFDDNPDWFNKRGGYHMPDDWVPLKGSELGNTDLTEADILYMREYFATHNEMKSQDIIALLANQFLQKEGTIDSIVYNMNWKHVKTFPKSPKNRRFPDGDVKDIRVELAKYIGDALVVKRKEIAAKYGASYMAVCRLEKRETYKDIK